jgi:ribosomal protein L22
VADEKNTEKDQANKKPATKTAGGSSAKKPAAKKAPAKKKPAAKPKPKAETATKGKGAAEATSKTADSKAADAATSKAPAKKAAAKKPAAKPKADTKAKAKAKTGTKAAAKTDAASTDRPVVNARARFVRVAPRKARLVADQVRGLPLEDALPLLRFSTRSAAQDIRKLLESAAANAETNHDLVADDLLIKDIHVDEGPTLRRYRPRALGRATRINKRTSHIAVALTPED